MDGRGRETDEIRRFPAPVPPDRLIAELARKQHAVVTLAQLLATGLSERGVHHRAATGQLHRLHRGVYAVVPREFMSRESYWIAAVFACGPRAVLSFRTCAALHGLRPTDRRDIDVTVAGRSRRSPQGVEVHRSTTLTRADVTRVRGILCTSVARTLLDLAAVIPRRPLERAFDQAEVMHVLDLRAIQSLLERNPRHRGAAAVRAILTEHYIGATPTVNELEEAFLAICRRAGVPQPWVNEWIDLGDGEPPIYADFVWREQRVIVETDGQRVHRTHQARERDPRRDQRALLAGWRPMRAPWRQVMRRPQELELALPRLLRQSRPPAAPG